MTTFRSSHPCSACAIPLVALLSTAAGAAAGDPCTPGWNLSLGDPGADSGIVGSVIVHDDGSGPALYAGGSYTAIGGVRANRIAKFDGKTWSPLGTGLSNAECYALGSYDGNLYAAGYFDQAGGVSGTAKLARWNGTAWESLGANLALFSNQLWDLTTFDDGTGEALYITGNFTGIGNTAADYVARYDGESFSPLGGPIAGNVPLILFTSHVFDDGTGPALYVGGRFTSIDGVPASRIARWDGTAWSALGSGIAGSGVAVSIMTMTTFDDGTGPALYVGGQAFTSAGGQPANRVAKWDGTEWSNVGEGFAGGIVWKLVVHDDGDGEALYAFGTFTASGTTPVERMAKWNGTAWEPFGGGASGTVLDALVVPGAAGDDLVIAGQFTEIGGDAANRLAVWEGCGGPGVPGDLNGDGVVDGADLGILLAAWGGDDAAADLDGNGVVDGADLASLLADWS